MNRRPRTRPHPNPVRGDHAVIPSVVQDPAWFDPSSKVGEPGNRSACVPLVNKEFVHPLNTPWVLWFHEVDDTRWTRESYRQLVTIYTWEDFLSVWSSFETFQKGMFFLMREGISPQWEDEHNIRGGYWSYKIPKTVGDEAWTQMASQCIGESLTVRLKDMYYVNGIATSPKIHHTIIKIMNRDATQCASEKLTSEVPYCPPKTVNFKPHIENREEFVYD